MVIKVDGNRTGIRCTIGKRKYGSSGCIDTFEKTDYFGLICGIAQCVSKAAVIGAVFHIRNNRSERLRRSIVVVRGQGKHCQERGDIETYAFAVVVVVTTERVLRRLQCAVGDCWGRFFISTNIVAEQIALTRHAEIKRADIAQETV